MMPKVGQLLRWYDNFTFDDDGPNHDVGIVKEVQLEGESWDVYTRRDTLEVLSRANSR